MPLQLTYQAETSVPVEVEGLTPDWARGKSLTEIERLKVHHGNRKVPLAELFAVAGSAHDKRIDFHGDLAGVHWIGAHMRSGEIHVHGPAGRHVGSQMRGGAIHVAGDADSWAGAEMRGGRIHVWGDAGDLAGAAYRGSQHGMTGGAIFIHGRAGREIGHTMRRGLIAVGDAAGDLAGYQMIAGTLLVFGECGIRPGAGMQGGTIGLFGPDLPPLLASFHYACTMRPPILPLLLSNLSRRGFAVPQTEPPLHDGRYDLYHGDLVSLGKGEFFLPEGRHPRSH